MKSTYLKCWLVIAFCFFASAGWSQVKKISGKVISGEDAKPLEGVSIIIKNKGTGAQTNTEGVFEIDASSGDVLVVSFTGFLSQEAKVGSSPAYNFSLQPGVDKLDEVVVVGYGTARRSKITSSIAKLDPKVLETGLRSNPAQALAGTIPGLRVSTGTGRPGSLPSIILRGGTNFDGSGSPLIVMDGQVRESLSDINPEDIGSMEVLKDASATAIYGARASNGVILITSKRGKAGSSSINLKVKRGTNYLNTPYNFLNAEDYVKWARLGQVQAIISGQQAPSSLAVVGPKSTGNLYKDPVTGVILDGNYDSKAIWSVMRLNDVNRELLSQPGWKQTKDAVPTDANGNYDPNGTYADLIFKDFNYGDYGLYDKSITQDYNIGMSGGNDRGGYFANIGYYDEGGLSLKTFYKRLTFTLNGDYKIKDWLKSESSLQFNKANWRDQSLNNGETNYWGRMLSAPPTMRGTDANGDLILGLNANDGNPVFNIDKYKRFNQTDKFTLGQSFKVDILKDLYFKLGAIWMYDEGVYETFNKDFRNGFLSYTNSNAGWDRSRQSTAGFDRTIRQTYNAIVNYQSSFGKNNIDAMAGLEYYDAYRRGLDASGRLAPTDDFSDLGLTLNNAITQTRGTDTYHNRDRIMSGFGRLLYDWDGKYLASVTVRRDGVSRLAGDNQYGTFPAASVGWLLHKESFLSSTRNWLSYLKLRASWGKNGNIGIGTNDAIGLYEVQGSYGSQSPYNGTIGFLQTGVALPTLKWERTNTTEVGADMGFFNNRLNASVAYYNRITDDKLAFVDLPTSSGISRVRTNNGSMRNRGVELDVNYKIIQNRDFTWQVSTNASWNKNTILKLPFNGNDKNRQGGTQVYNSKIGNVIWGGGVQEGQEWGELFGFVSDGIIRDAKDLAEYNKIDLAAGQVWQNGAAGKNLASQKLITEKGLVNFWATQLGDMKWKDFDNNDTIDYRDRTSLGRTLPRWTGGFNTTVTWKGFSLFARLDFALGHVQQDFMRLWSLAYAQGDFNATDAVKDTWTPDNPNAKFPRYTRGDQNVSKNFDRPSNMFFVSSSYLAFREVSLSYSLPASLLKKARISGLTFTATGQNLGYITNKLLNLPERTGAQNSAYTIPTQLIFGANLTF
ncbi:MAG TPA: SusC/RagA family TonB-linked outer membrane protein [Hanamia sp.]